MSNLVEVRDEIKAAVENCTGTPTAKLVAILVAAGITSTAEIAAICGLKTRAVQIAKRTTMRNDVDGHAHQDAPAHHNAPKSAPGCAKAHQDAPQSAPQCASEKPAHIATRASKESPTEIVISKKDSPFIPQDPYDRAIFENGRLVLLNGCREFWLDKFGGDAERLDLALTQAAGYVQPNNRYKPLEAQVGAQLARIAAEKRDKDQRYAAAVKAKTPAASPSHPQTSRAARTAEFRAVLERTRKPSPEAVA